jgi:hypothetical protein
VGGLPAHRASRSGIAGEAQPAGHVRPRKGRDHDLAGAMFTFRRRQALPASRAAANVRRQDGRLSKS